MGQAPIMFEAREIVDQFELERGRGMKDLKPSSRVRLKNILYATDFSTAAEKALPFAVQIAKRYEARIYVLHVAQENLYPLIPPPAWSEMEKETAAFRDDKKRILDEQLSGISHGFLFQQGNVWENIKSTIRKEGIDLLVLGTHGRTGLGKMALGSITEQALRCAPCPLLTVGPKVSVDPKHAAEWTRILYATDFSTSSLAAAPHAISLAREHRAHLILLHCGGHEEEVQVMLHTLRDLVPFGSDLRAEPDCVVVRGSPEAKILEVAEEHGADVIVLGLPSAEVEHASNTILDPRAIYKILSRSTCPVMTICA